MTGSWAVGLIRHRGVRLAVVAAGIATAVALLAVLGSFLTRAQASMTGRAIRGVTVDWQVAGDDLTSLMRALHDTSGVRHTEPVGYATTSGLVATTPATLGATTQTTGPGTVLGLGSGYAHTFPGSLRILVGDDHGALVAQQTAANLHVAPGDTVLVGRGGLPPARVRVSGIVELPQADSLFQAVGAPPSAQPVAPPDNVVVLGTTLDAARSDAAYARILFLFLGAPAAVLAGLLTAVVVATGAPRRRREQALLRARGATDGHLVRLAAVEAVLVGVAGAAAGLAAAAVISRSAFAVSPSAGWATIAAAAGLVVAGGTVVLPAWRGLRQSTVAADRAGTRPVRVPAWRRFGVDFVLLAAGGLVFWSTSRDGYQLVLVPEGVPTISVSYCAFAAPALLWTGTALVVWRLTDVVLSRGRPVLRHAFRPLAGNLAGVLANSASRQRTPLARAVVLLGLALAFAASTATFTATYRAQADVDAQLTNGADVTVTPSPGAAAPPGDAARIAAVPGVRGVEPLQHRYAYVGSDLQDLYGVRPDTITGVTALRDTYFQGGAARALMDRLATHEDSVLVSAETVRDLQLHPGDRLNLRLQDGRTKKLLTVPFRFAGVVTEFPTAPSDSFLVANAGYVAKMTGSGSVGAFLIDTGGTDVTAVAGRVRDLLGPSAVVTDLAHTRGTIGSSLTSVDLTGLRTIELGFGVALAAAAGTLVLALGLAERRRSFAIAAALGAQARQLRAFVTTEAAVLTVGGLAGGALIGWLVTHVLVTTLSGVFDPPPDALTVPWPYLATVAGTLLAAIAAVTTATMRLARTPPPRVLREL